MLCNAEDRTDEERTDRDIQQKPDGAGVLIQVQFSVYTVSAVSDVTACVCV